MDRLKTGVDFIFSSYKRVAAMLVIGGLLLAIPVTMSVVGNQQDLRQQASETAGTSCQTDADCNTGFACTGSGGDASDRVSTCVATNSTTQVATPTPGPLNTTGATISSSTITANGTTKYQVTITTADSSGGNNINRQVFAINLQGPNAEQHRGLVSWSSAGFASWQGSYKTGTTPLKCFTLGPVQDTTVAGEAVMYNGYGSEYINLAGCYSQVTGNTRTAKFDIQFYPNYTSPLSNNTLSGYSENSSGQVSDWKAFSSFNVSASPTTIVTPIPTTSYACTTDDNCSNGLSCKNNFCVAISATPSPGGTALTVYLSLVGIGIGEDGINTDPKRPERKVEVELVDSSNNFAGVGTGTATFQPSTGLYVGTIPLPDVASAVYTVKARMDNTLWKRIPGIINVAIGQNTQAQPATLVTGDFNQDNVINLIDYNMIVSCAKNQGVCKDIFSKANIKNFVAYFKKQATRY